MHPHGNDLLLDIDVQGAAQVRSQMPESVGIFVMPPSPRSWRTVCANRSRAEGSISESDIQARLAKARVEIENYDEYGYILVNDSAQPCRRRAGGHRCKREVSSGPTDTRRSRYGSSAGYCRPLQARSGDGPCDSGADVVRRQGTGTHSLTVCTNAVWPVSCIDAA